MRFAPAPRGDKRWPPKNPRTRKRVLVSLFVAACLGLLFVGPYASYLVDYRYSPFRPLPPSREGFEALGAMALAVPDYYRHWFHDDSELPKMNLDIKYEHFHKIIRKRSVALDQRYLETSSADSVPATLTVDGNAMRVKIRLKGDFDDHFRSQRWSYRVEVKDGGSFDGMTKFSIQAPYTRGFQLEPLYFDLVRPLGVLAPRYQFVELVVNGKRIGVTAVEEHFTRELVESAQRREGPILKYDEAARWDSFRVFGSLQRAYSSWRNTPIDGFGSAKFASSPNLQQLFDEASGRMLGLARGLSMPSEVMDAKLWGRYLAACEVFSASHSAVFVNIRLYFNPVTYRIEPIAYDVASGLREGNWPGLRCQGAEFVLTDYLMSDPLIEEAFFDAIKEITSVTNASAVLRDLQEREAHYIAQLSRDFPWLKPIDWDAVRQRMNFLSRLRPSKVQKQRFRRIAFDPVHNDEPDYPALVFAYLETDANGSTLVFDNILPRTVRVSELSVAVRVEGVLRKVPFRLDTSPPFTLAPTSWLEIPTSVRVPLDLLGSSPEAVEMSGIAYVDDGTRAYPFEVRRRSAAIGVDPVPSSDLATLLTTHPFLEQSDERGKWLEVRAGTWDVEGWLAPPEGFGLRIGPGTTLRFAAHAGVVLRGPIEILGTSESPVVLTGKPEPAGAGWRGLAVLESERPSKLSHVRVQNTTGVRNGLWQLTGGVTFRLSNVVIEESAFEDNLAEDALNVIRSNFELRNVHFNRTASDAVDADFATGTITDSSFVSIGGDGIDSGGSIVEIRDTKLSNVRDKALSAGEGSDVVATRLTVEGASVGVASKDASKISIRDSTFREIQKIGIAAYVKKPVYGPAQVEALQVDVSGPGRGAIAQTGSVVSLDGVVIPAETFDVDAFYGKSAPSP
ncbi:MAG: hypothetical protein ACI8W3_001992 [Myxococcota bacterium]|jgi:hypothetical protein